MFYSPIVYTPQKGKAITALYLKAAGQTLPGKPAPLQAINLVHRQMAAMLEQMKPVD